MMEQLCGSGASGRGLSNQKSCSLLMLLPVLSPMSSLFIWGIIGLDTQISDMCVTPYSTRGLSSSWRICLLNLNSQGPSLNQNKTREIVLFALQMKQKKYHSLPEYPKTFNFLLRSDTFRLINSSAVSPSEKRSLLPSSDFTMIVAISAPSVSEDCIFHQGESTEQAEL